MRMKDAIQVARTLESDEYDFREGCRILELWNQAVDPALSVARARVPPGVTTRLHRLAGTVERYLILSGQGLMVLPDGNTQAVGPGDLVYIPANAPQRITNGGAEDLIFLALCTPRFEPGCYLDLDPTED
ncbi:MAG: cupin domain-containing protein [Chromatiaceae bacterium]|nr:cupin domain-containing protein [Chromatiaceae bacterium]